MFTEEIVQHYPTCKVTILMKGKNTMKKSISIILAVLMLVSCIPMFASAAEQITLTDDNVVTYPTAEGSIYAGQKIGDYITLAGGEVRYDLDGSGTLDEGETVAGKFDIVDEDKEIIITTAGKSVTIKFIPDDIAAYTEIAITKKISVKGNGRPVTIVEYPTYGEIEPGAKLRTLTFTGGKVIDNETQEEVAIRMWRWKNQTTVVNESGYYPVNLYFTDNNNYSTVSSLSFYVRIVGDTSEAKIPTSITEIPTPSTTTVKVGDSLKEITFTGGKAVDINGNEVSGSYSVKVDAFTAVGERSTYVVFNPDDSKYASSEAVITFTVETGSYKFFDKDGYETTPVYTILYGTKIGDDNITIDTIIGQTGCYLNAKSKYAYYAPDGQNYIISGALYGTILPVGEHTFYVKVKPSGYTINQTPPYEATTLAFIIKVEPVTMSVTNVSHSGFNNELTVTADKAGVSGTADIYIDGELIGDDISFADNSDKTKAIAKTEWSPEEKVNKEYTVKVVYNPIENDPVSMEDYEGTFRTNLPFTVYKDGLFTMYYGKDTVSGDSYSPAWEGSTRIQCVVPYEYQADFITWYITDEDGNELDIEIYGIEKTQGTGAQVGTLVETKVEAELSDTTIYFDMPNCNVRVSYKTQSMLDEEAKQEAIDNCDCLCHYTNPIAEFIWKIISFFMNLFGIDKPCNCGYPHIVK